MAVIYVRSTTGASGNSGAGWATAKDTIANALAISAAGDTIWVSQVHAEAITGTTTWTGTSTLTAPIKILCGNDAAEPPTALATTATASNTTGFSCATVGLYIYGITVTMAGSSSSVGNICDAAQARQVWDNCSFVFTTTGGSALLGLGGSSSFNPSELILNTCTFKLAATSQVLVPRCKVRINGGSWLSGGTNPTQCFGGRTVSRAMDCIVTGFDFSNLATAQTFCDGSSGGVETGYFIMRYCKLPASWNGSLLNGATLIGFHAEMHGCSASNTTYNYWRETGFGTLKHETTIVMTSGASDGTTSIAYKMTTPNSVNLYPATYLESEEFAIWCNTTGSAKTLTVPIVHDSVTNLKDNDIWLRAHYLGNASFPLSTMIEDVVASVVATAADQASSAVTWTTTGLTNPNKQELSVTFTPQQKGYVIYQVIMALKNKTIYFNPPAALT